MLDLLLAVALPALPPVPPQTPTSKPTSRPTQLSDRERMQPSDWGDDAPGTAVVPAKFLAIRKAPYASAAAVVEKGWVKSEDLVIGLVVGDQPVAYHINMLGGPQREIINEEYNGVPFCVNW